MALGDPRRRILTISEVSLLIRRSLEEQFADIWIEGEVSNLRAPGSGHLYFTLKDEQSQIRGVLFRSATPHLRFALREGLHVIVRGRVTVYELRGEYQLVVEYVEPKGIGALQLAFEQLKERLAHEGLFDQGRKRPLPLFPRSVGVVTSLTGAAIRDILSVLHRRWPILNILVMPVPVQGEGAAAEIAKAIQLLSASESVDVVIVGRGGGSLEDLWCFNEEVVVRAIAECKAPVVSAVGHETDYTLADFAADYRAATPSVAAEAVAPVLRDTVVRLHQQTERCLRAITMQVALVRMRLGDGESNMRNVRGHLQREAQRLDDLYAKLVFSAQETIFHHRRLSLDNHYALMARSPITLVKEA
ncbi:MAG: exodeoxyribonuclease VII large subunit, partial [Nitrospiraceae bacterium]